ncbi:putative acyl-CoA dehydrogenase [Pedococcus dokdonensis]|uniref:Putative acyl-CoA dehydrogenase n=1 Tax=Pedococcus dokdonensis TaxID=443156 RepID=A0A1H0N6H3_9MICO|nr:acyl-CoA dehydrogenase family protein [Pedococcus dokdonensis]SDO88329.1 putative acyl-CoA dehydrogenase [Pedococcus dokdonensis]
MPTHAVTNQVPPLPEVNTVTSQPALAEGLRRWAGPAAHDEITALGARAGSAEARSWAVQANAHEPVLRTHSPTGERVDEVDFHPAWHSLMTAAVGAGLTAEPWTQPQGGDAHLRRAAGFIAWSENEQGHLCPVSMTYAAGPALAANPTLAARWLPQLASRSYDFGLRPLADKRGALVGMGMTEKQGGSDVRANTTRAVRTPGGPVEGGDSYRLTGHKWFCSAPMSDGFLVLAQTEAGVGCFLVPRVLDDGSRNSFALQRLKDKLGNRSNASSEVELDGTWGVLVGDEGRGIRTILDMVAATRLDCILGSASTMRAALVRAVHHARHRSAFGALLVDQPLMQNVLADLALEVEAATTLALRLAHAVDEGDTALSRLGVAVGKYWVCKRTAPMVAEALECLGGNGYVEENGLARLYREAPLNSIWEGSGNVNALDVLRAISREPLSVEAFRKEVALAHGHSAVLDAAIARVDEVVRSAAEPGAQAGARRVVEHLALTLQASLLARHAPAEVADAFVASRLGGAHGVTFGTLEAGLSAGHARTIVDRAFTA